MFENNVHLIIVVEIAVTLISSKIRENFARIVKRKARVRITLPCFSSQ